MTTCGWTGDTWRWDCTAHGGLRNSTWNLLSSNDDVVLEGVKGVELVKNDKYTKLVRAAPQLYEALAETIQYAEGFIRIYPMSEEAKASLAKARAALAAARGEG